MIKSKKELQFYIKADSIMNGYQLGWSLKRTLMEILSPNYIQQYLKCMRKKDYYSCKDSLTGRILFLLNSIKSRRLGVKLGFSISTCNVGYGLVIPHYGTIVVGAGNTIGNYAVLHTSTCITQGQKKIGNGLYLSTGGKIIHDIEIGNNVSIGANSLVNKSFIQNDILVAGSPATKIKSTPAWYVRDGEEYIERVNLCEELKKKMNIE